MPYLHWLTREEDLRRSAKAPFRLLEYDPALSAGDQAQENMIIQGDNLEALKALLPVYAGRVKCIYIDPPYNTGSAFEHYDDNMEHTLWLSMMYPRLELLHELLDEKGSIWISIDEEEGHYLKVLCDEIFGRNNFITQMSIKRSAPTGHKAINPSPVQVTDLILLYAKDKERWKYKVTHTERGYDKAYNKIIVNYEDDCENWKFMPLKKYLKENNLSIDDCLQKYPNKIIRFAQPNYDGVGKETKALIDRSKENKGKIFLQARENHPDIYLYKGDRILFYSDKLKNIDGKLLAGEVLTNIWLDIPYQGIAGEGDVEFRKSKKPEKLIKRCIEISSNNGDIVLDSFLGSGTAAAVAHKMNRRYIGVEIGDHSVTHCVPRLKKVIEGEQGGISKDVNWPGGGGFRFYRLGEAIFDDMGKINPKVRFAQLASHVWFCETATPLVQKKKSPFLGEYKGVGYYLLYNGILGDKTPDGGNVLTGRVLKSLPQHKGPKVIYGEITTLGKTSLHRANVEFKQIPYEIKAR